jgi:uroporphyrinogen III methyltransferase / synthase
VSWCDPLEPRVWLVGAGPGDPGLITWKGLQCLQRADVVLYDGLVNPLLLNYARAHAVRTCRIESVDGRRLDQPAITRQLIELAQAGQTVVRLKGGDPYIFGRGAEEAAALHAAGIPFEVVPGVTAATAGAIYAGLSLTHRNHASAVAFITGHEDPTKPEQSLDYEALARFPGTLVFYMGLHRLAAITARLQTAGLDGDTPAAVLCRVTTPRQRQVISTLGELACAASQAELSAPSLVVIGRAVSQPIATDWFWKRPLLGQTIGVTRSEDGLGPVIEAVLRAGGQPLPLPTATIERTANVAALDAAFDQLPQNSWVVWTSANGVRHSLQRWWERGGDARRLAGCQLAAIGPSTADELLPFGLRCDFVPSEYDARHLAEELAPRAAGQRVLWIRGERARDELVPRLQAHGIHVDEVVAYRQVDVAQWSADTLRPFVDGTLNWLAVSSVQAASRLAELVPEPALSQLGQRIQLAAISERVAARLRELGWTVSVIADPHTWDGLLAGISAHQLQESTIDETIR